MGASGKSRSVGPLHGLQTGFGVNPDVHPKEINHAKERKAMPLITIKVLSLLRNGLIKSTYREDWRSSVAKAEAMELVHSS
jgi:hypothetical protein